MLRVVNPAIEQYQGLTVHVRSQAMVLKLDCGVWTGSLKGKGWMNEAKNGFMCLSS